MRNLRWQSISIDIQNPALHPLKRAWLKAWLHSKFLLWPNDIQISIGGSSSATFDFASGDSEEIPEPVKLLLYKNPLL